MQWHFPSFSTTRSAPAFSFFHSWVGSGPTKVNANNGQRDISDKRITNYISVSTTTTTYQFSLWPVQNAFRCRHTALCSGDATMHTHLHTQFRFDLRKCNNLSGASESSLSSSSSSLLLYRRSTVVRQIHASSNNTIPGALYLNYVFLEYNVIRMDFPCSPRH